MNIIKLTTKNIANKTRLDKYLSDNIEDITRNKIKKLIEEGNVKKNNIIFTDCSYIVKDDEEYEIIIPPPPPTNLEAANIDIDIIFEDENFLVINKQAGLTVHPGAGNYNDTLANALVNHFENNLSKVSGDDRPGIVHRLDKDTSGLMLIAKNDKTHHYLSEKIALKKVQRYYLALCWAVPSPTEGRIENYIARSNFNRTKMAIFENKGKIAITNYKVKEILFNGQASLVEFKLETGRTHQIRVQITDKGNSIIGDQTYGRSNKKAINKIEDQNIKDYIDNFNRQALHSYKLILNSPTTNKEITFETKLPDDMEKLFQYLKKI